MSKTVQNASHQGAQSAEAAKGAALRLAKLPSQPENSLTLMQSAYGNQGVLKLLTGGILQRKLTINRPGDIYEQEADRMADCVIRMSGPAAASERVASPNPAAGLQRCACAQASSRASECQDCKTHSLHMTHASARPPQATPL